eukprot:m.162910 g.162910  ORF g.162910 m.162910 type:complete len:307 (-) comp18087_c0_seq3:331-1251(-)
MCQITVLFAGAVFCCLGGLGLAKQCPPTLKPGEHEISINVPGSGSRSISVYVPTNMDALKSPRPGYLTLHGCGSNPGKFETVTFLNEYAERNNFFNVYPKGTGFLALGWNPGPDGVCITVGSSTRDADFMAATIDWMKENLCLDDDLLFASGFSNGGEMIFNMSCDARLDSQIAAYAYSGSVGSAKTTVCSKKPMLGMCGSNDAFCKEQDLLALYERLSSDRGCTGASTEKAYSNLSTCVSRTAGCSGAVEACYVRGLDHCWGGATCCDDCSVQSPDNLPFTEHMLEFFQKVRDDVKGTTNGASEQ